MTHDALVHAATVDRIPFAAWAAEQGISRSTAYRRLGEAGLEPVNIRGKSYLTSTQLEQLEAYEASLEAEATHGALTHAGTSQAALTHASTPQGAMTHAATMQDAAAHAETVLTHLQARAAAAQAVAGSGLAIGTAEAALILGAKPTGDRFQRGRLVAIRAGVNAWTLDQAA
jgi:hypothetical protein